MMSFFSKIGKATNPFPVTTSAHTKVSGITIVAGNLLNSVRIYFICYKYLALNTQTE